MAAEVLRQMVSFPSPEDGMLFYSLGCVMQTGCHDGEVPADGCEALGWFLLGAEVGYLWSFIALGEVSPTNFDGQRLPLVKVPAANAIVTDCTTSAMSTGLEFQKQDLLTPSEVLTLHEGVSAAVYWESDAKWPSQNSVFCLKIVKSILGCDAESILDRGRIPLNIDSKVTCQELYTRAIENLKLTWRMEVQRKDFTRSLIGKRDPILEDLLCLGPERLRDVGVSATFSIATRARACFLLALHLRGCVLLHFLHYAVSPFPGVLATTTVMSLSKLARPSESQLDASTRRLAAASAAGFEPPMILEAELCAQLAERGLRSLLSDGTKALDCHAGTTERSSAMGRAIHGAKAPLMMSQYAGSWAKSGTVMKCVICKSVVHKPTKCPRCKKKLTICGPQCFAVSWNETHKKKCASNT